MRALAVSPGVPNSARIEQIGEPSPADGDIRVETVAIGICGTNRELMDRARNGPKPRWREALQKRPGDIKVILEFAV